MYREACGRMDGWTSRGQLRQGCCGWPLPPPPPHRLLLQVGLALPCVPRDLPPFTTTLALRRVDYPFVRPSDDANIDYLYLYTVAGRRPTVFCRASLRRTVAAFARRNVI